MDRFDAMRVFVAVAEAEGFAPAARRLAMSPPAVTRAVAALEERVGARLLHRTTRVVRLTEAGAGFLADCRRILAEIEEAEDAAAGSHAEVRGPLSVTAPVMFGRMFVAPILFGFLARHRRVTTRALLVDRIVDLIDEGVDVGIRIAHLGDSAMHAIRVGTVRRVVCAAPSYLATHGTPRQPADLRGLDAVASAAAGAVVEWAFASASRVATVRPQAQLVVNGAEVAIAAAIAGRGVTRVLSYQIAHEVRAGRLAIVLADFEPPPIPIHIVHYAGRRPAARVRSFVDFAVARLRADPALD